MTTNVEYVKINCELSGLLITIEYLKNNCGLYEQKAPIYGAVKTQILS